MASKKVAPKKEVKKVVEKVPAKKKVIAVLEIDGAQYKGEGETDREALAAIPFPLRVVTKGTITLDKKVLHLPADYLRGLRSRNAIKIEMLKKRFDTVK